MHTTPIATRHPFRPLIEILGLALLYIVTAQFGFLFAIAPGNVTIMWLPAGLAVAGMLLFGPSAGLGIWLGSFVANFLRMGSETPWLTALIMSFAIACGSTFQAFIAMRLMKRWQITTLASRVDLAKFVVMTALACLIAATVGVTTLFSVNAVATNAYLFTWVTWWLGDWIGMVISTPVWIPLGTRLFKKTWVVATPIIVVGIGLGASLGLFAASRAMETQVITTEFSSDTQVIHNILEHSLNQALNNLNAVKSFIAASKQVTSAEFRTFTLAELTDETATKGLQALSWNPYVLFADRAAYEAEGRREGFADFSFTERNAEGKLIPAAARADYVIVKFIEPLETNLAALGYDVYSNPLRHDAIVRARDTGRAAMTAPITLVQETGSQKGFLVFNPLYRKGVALDSLIARQANLLGFAVAVIRAGDLVEAALAPIAAQIVDLDIYVFDMDAPPEGQLLHAHSAPSRAEALVVNPKLDPSMLQHAIYYQQDLELGGRHWLLVTTPAPGVIEAHRLITPWGVLATGIIFTAMLAGYLANRKQAEDALQASETSYRTLGEQYRGLMESLDNVIAALDVDGRFLYMNGVAAKQLGGAAETLIGKTMDDLFSEQIALSQLQGIQQVIREDKGATFEYPNRVNGQLRWHRTSVQPIHDATGRVAYALMNATDIHDLKTAQQQLLELNRTLEERVRTRTADLSRVNAELEHAVRAKAEFLANMSHELRTPLNAILALSETLLEQVRGPLNDRQQASLRSIENSGRHLLSLINDILDLSKIEAGKVELQRETVTITEVCQASLSFVKEIALKKQLQIAFQLNDHLAQFEADPKRVKQMLVNLLSNAVKFTAEGGKVSLEVETDSNAQMVRFSVQDTGIGIAPQDLERLFQPFTQLDSSLSRQHEGTGLGLALTHRLAELHGGSIVVESQVDKGSRFTIILPYNRSKPVKEESAATNFATDAVSLVAPLEPLAQALSVAPLLAAVAPTRVLLVEDNDFNIEAIGEYLQDRGYYVVVARNGYEALEQAKEVDPAVILMDIQMPHMDGLEATRRLRANPRFATTPIIALTALAMEGDRERCLAAGANEYLTKPVALKGLVATIERLLQP